jgi:hypothetical protein
MPRKTSVLALLIVLLLASGGAAWSMGQKMDIFVPVDALIEQKQYSEAIDMLRGLLVSAPSKTNAIKERIAKVQLLLADDEIAAQHYNEALSALRLFWEQNPERADQAQNRIRKINKVREDYNKQAKELLTYMRDEKNRVDPEYNVNVTKRLEDLDNLDRNNPDSKKTIISLKETSLALVNQDSMKLVMSSGRKSIDAGAYVQATRDYLKGFSLFRPEFMNAGYDELTVQAVAGLVKQAEALPDSYEAMQTKLTESIGSLEAAFLSGKPEAIAAAQGAAQSALDELGSIRKAAFATGANMARSYDAIPKEGKSPIEYQYLAYLDIFTRGRPDSFDVDKKPVAERGLPEGLGGAILSQTDSLVGRLQKAAESSIDTAYASAEKYYDTGDFATAQAELDRASALIAPGAKVLENWGDIAESDFVPELAALKAEIALAPAVSKRLAALDSVAQAGSRLARIVSSYIAADEEAARYVASQELISGKVPLKDARSALDGYRQAVAKASVALAVEAKAKAGLGAAAIDAAAAIGDDRPNSTFAAYSGRLDRAMASALADEYAIAASQGKIEGDYIGRELALRTEEVAAAEALIEGSLSPRPDRAKAGYKDPSPSKGSIALAAEADKLAALVSWTSSDLSSMDKESEGLRENEAFAAVRSAIAELGTKTAELESRRAASLAKAIESKKSAAATLTKAREDMAAAEVRLDATKDIIAKDKGTKSAAIKKGFEDAKTKLESGLAGVLDSANLDFDGDSWDRAQKLYASLSADLAQTKKDYTVNETFRLLGEAQTYYDQALFDLANESLTAAQELWHEENDSDQEQVKYWQNLVKQASDTNNKREVRQSDAMYYEIGSYLSDARALYFKGDSLMKLGRKADADAAFDSARQNLSFVTRAFPLNAEAGLLTLQILKSTDADAYKKSLPRRIQEAVDLLGSDASSGYSRIADLYKMEPGYPGLKATLEKAEIKVGKRRAPPTKEELASAQSYVAQAEGLLKSGRKDDALRAESDLNAALGYDPTNKQAFALLRDLKTLQGKTSGPTLGLADQAILDQATRDFAARSYNKARDDLAELLAEADKRTREVLKLDNDLKTLGY